MNGFDSMSLQDSAESPLLSVFIPAGRLSEHLLEQLTNLRLKSMLLYDSDNMLT